MENSVIVKNERRLSGVALFFVCMLTTLGIGLTVVYCSGIIGGVKNTASLPFIIPRWLVLALPPVLFFHLGLSLFLALRENVYTDNGRMVRVWSWVFFIALFCVSAATPYFIYYNMPTAAYIMSSIATALAIGTAILMYRQSIASGIVMTVFLAVVALIMVYLGYWAFA